MTHFSFILLQAALLLTGVTADAVADQTPELDERYEKQPTCRQVTKLTQYLKGQHDVNKFCQTYLGIKCKTTTKIIGTKTVTIRVKITKTITGDNVQVTPEPSTDDLTATATNTATDMVTTTPTMTTTTTTTVMISEGEEAAPTPSAKRDLETRGSYSFNKLLRKVAGHPQASISAACTSLS